MVPYCLPPLEGDIGVWVSFLKGDVASLEPFKNVYLPKSQPVSAYVQNMNVLSKRVNER